ncbi:MAG: hypothetical protein GF316_18640 [Candidatus Lokiarchaeota archaeon]|nr:hypothetical protein [Candidatus Lokiarchaeota archaeon]
MVPFVSIIIKSISTIFIGLSIFTPWNNLNPNEYNSFGLVFTILLFFVYLISIALTYLGIIDKKRFQLIEKLGIIISSITLVTYVVYHLVLTLIFPSQIIFMQLGFIFAVVSLVIIIGEKYLLRKAVMKFSLKITDRRKLKKTKERIKKKKEEAAVTQKVEVKNEPKKKIKRTISLSLINPISIMLKATVLIIFIIGYLLVYSNIELTQYIEVTRNFVKSMHLILMIAIIVSYIGFIEKKITNIVEKVGILTGFSVITIIMIVEFLNNLINSSRYFIYELGTYIIFLSTVVSCIDLYIIRKLINDKKRKKKKDTEEEQQINILERYSRIETKADFPERWALIHGNKPTEKEDFIHFKEIKIEKESSKHHPNYLHLIIEHLIEDKGYRIETSEKPLKDEDDSYKFYDLNGLIKGGIKVSLKGKLGFASISILIIGILFLLVSILLLISNLILLIFNLFLIILSVLVLIPFSSLFLIYYLIKTLKSSSFRKLGYINIYVLERGIAYYGREYAGIETESSEKIIKKPTIGFKLKISFATCVKTMDANNAIKDLDEIISKIQTF